MDLEQVSGQTHGEASLCEWKLRFYISAILALFVMAFSMFNALPWVQAALTTPIVLWGAWPFFARGYQSVRTLNLNMFTLISLGIATAYIYSLVAIQYHDLPVYFEAAAAITTLTLAGQYLEGKARTRTGAAIRRLLDLHPKTAMLVLKNKTEKTIPLSSVKVSDILRVRPGEHIPVDGSLIEGASFVNEAMLTGEAASVEKVKGSKLSAGTLNLDGTFLMRAEKVGSDTLLSHIIRLVQEAQRSRPPIQKLADSVSSYFVPAVIAAAFITFGVWYIYGPEPVLTHSIIQAVSVLIIACPCALGLATPMSVMVGVGKGAQSGILIKNAVVLEKMCQITTLAIDKTGTLTEGNISLTNVIGPREEILKLAASVEQGSEHPLARTIIQTALAANIELLKLSGFKALPGKGIFGRAGRTPTAVGNRLLMQEFEADTSPWEGEAKTFESQGQTVLFIAKNHTCIGLLAVSDKIKESTPPAIKTLKKEGVKIVMVTGDTSKAASIVGETIGVDLILSQVLPAAKYEIVKKFQAGGEIVGMAGDGINDSPALAQADVGIAMGNGTDVAIESADISLVKGDLNGIVRARALSKAVMRNIRQNLFLAFIYNLIGIPIAAGVLYPHFGIILSPMIASVAMTLSSLSVVGNALRLYRAKITDKGFEE